jgi:hypothetical protein
LQTSIRQIEAQLSLMHAHEELEELADELTTHAESLELCAAECRDRELEVAGSLSAPSLRVWKHWKCVRAVNATRATFSGERCLDRRRGKIVATDLVRRIGHDLHRRQNASRNQVTYHVVGNTQGLRRLAHGEPFAIVFC